jgi:broad specificity phosphatase PhoE
MRLFVFARHAESTLNLERRVNGDPTKQVDLTERGRYEAAQLGLQLQGLGLDVCVHTRFSRTKQTAELALSGRDVPCEVEPLLDDIDVGDLEGSTIEDYRAWKHGHARSEAFPGGESLDDAARRYADAFRRLLAGPHRTMLIVTHEIPIRYALNGAAGSDSLDGPAHELRNATPFLFDEHGLQRAVDGIERVLAGTVPA